MYLEYSSEPPKKKKFSAYEGITGLGISDLTRTKEKKKKIQNNNVRTPGPTNKKRLVLIFLDN